MEPQFLRQSCIDLDSYLHEYVDGELLQANIDGNQLYNKILSFKPIVTRLEELKPYFVLTHQSQRCVNLTLFYNFFLMSESANLFITIKYYFYKKFVDFNANIFYYNLKTYFMKIL